MTDRINGPATLRVDAAGRGGAMLGTWTARFGDAERGGIALVDLQNIASGSATFILNPPTSVPCPGRAFGSLAGGFILELTGTEQQLSGRSRYTTCDDDAEGRVELTRQ